MSDWDDYLDPFACPVCGNDKCIPISGSHRSKIMVVGDAPNKFDINAGRAFAGGTGEMLRKELAHLGFDIYSAKLGYLWKHEPNTDTECFQDGLKAFLAEAKDAKLILLVGTEITKYFVGKSPVDVNGLLMTSDKLSAPVIPMLPLGVVFGSGLGEIRFALRQFVKAVEELE